MFSSFSHIFPNIPRVDMEKTMEETTSQPRFPINGIRVESMEVKGPGEAVVQGSMSWSVLRLCGVLFGDMGSQAAWAEGFGFS